MVVALHSLLESRSALPRVRSARAQTIKRGVASRAPISRTIPLEHGPGDPEVPNLGLLRVGHLRLRESRSRRLLGLRLFRNILGCLASSFATGLRLFARSPWSEVLVSGGHAQLGQSLSDPSVLRCQSTNGPHLNHELLVPVYWIYGNQVLTRSWVDS